MSVSGFRCFIELSRAVLQNTANLSSALVVFNGMMAMAARDRPSGFSCRKRLSLQTHTQSVSMLEHIAAQHQAKCELELLHVMMCNCTPRIRAFISVTVQLPNEQSHNSWSTL